ncbi:hypothetical protein tloyanaT_00420 [Thalassotalea loyana]|uniref:Uncharacterized protein n=1 Tax=Thalassotalea loyana TaxID=280483 RepID=A0ABQ6H6M1_9GAMM|nr:hypothetical protein [Thalassotalea loyana]GLX83790.1 hypothetical protein tloyanaT_00420 [Thalassotalea loyana]
MDTLTINNDKNLYSVDHLPLITVYDDNWFLRNDYDVLSPGQRNYLASFFKQNNFVTKTGKTMSDGRYTVHFPRPQSNLAISAYDAKFIESPQRDIYCLTPTQFAEALFYFGINETGEENIVDNVKALIEKCPYNIEWLRDISYRTPIEQVTIETFNELMAYQKQIIENKFKKKKALK